MSQMELFYLRCSIPSQFFSVVILKITFAAFRHGISDYFFLSSRLAYRLFFPFFPIWTITTFPFFTPTTTGGAPTKFVSYYQLRGYGFNGEFLSIHFTCAMTFYRFLTTIL
jgi:hypothetical protein